MGPRHLLALGIYGHCHCLQTGSHVDSAVNTQGGRRSSYGNVLLIYTRDQYVCVCGLWLVNVPGSLAHFERYGISYICSLLNFWIPPQDMSVSWFYPGLLTVYVAGATVSAFYSWVAVREEEGTEVDPCHTQSTGRLQRRLMTQPLINDMPLK